MKNTRMPPIAEPAAETRYGNTCKERGKHQHHVATAPVGNPRHIPIPCPVVPEMQGDDRQQRQAEERMPDSPGMLHRGIGAMTGAMQANPRKKCEQGERHER